MGKYEEVSTLVIRHGDTARLKLYRDEKGTVEQILSVAEAGIFIATLFQIHGSQETGKGLESNDIGQHIVAAIRHRPRMTETDLE